MKNVYLICEILAILSQMFHNYWIVVYTSGLSDRLEYGPIIDVDGSRPNRTKKGRRAISPKQIQAWAFCSIIDASIIFAVIENVIWWSIGGILILLAINYFYVYNVYEDYATNSDKLLQEKATTRRKALAYFVATIMPVCIYVFAELYAGKGLLSGL